MVTELIGRKIGMTQVYDDAGNLAAVTVIELGPCRVVQVKTAETDGYSAVQLGFGHRKPKNVNRPLSGHYAKAGLAPAQVLREVRAAGDEGLEAGQEIKADIFQAGERVDITGTTKGRGTAGVIKRWGFHGAPETHGAKKIHRHGGSLGPGTWPARVIKGRRMAGRYGADRRTVKSLRVVKVDLERNLLLVSGAVPGHKNSICYVRKATSARRREGG
jgi:large subunit ribosomal protein L3